MEEEGKVETPTAEADSAKAEPKTSDAYTEGYTWLFELAGGPEKSKRLVFNRGDTTLVIRKGKAINGMADNDSLLLVFDSPHIEEGVLFRQSDISIYMIGPKDSNTGVKDVPLSTYSFEDNEYPPDVTSEEAKHLKQELREKVFGRVKEFAGTAAQQAKENAQQTQEKPSKFQTPLARYLGKHLGKRSS